MRKIGNILNIDSNSKRAYYLKGALYFDLNDTINAIQNFNKAVSIDTNCAQSYFERAFCFNYFGYIDSALSDYNIAISLDSTNALYYRKRGNMLFESNNDVLGCLKNYQLGLR